MAKHKKTSSLKGILEIDVQTGSSKVTEITKETEKTFDLSSILASYNHQLVTVTITQEDDIEPMLD